MNRTDRKTKILFAAMLVIILAAIAAAYYRYIVVRNFTVVDSSVSGPDAE